MIVLTERQRKIVEKLSEKIGPVPIQDLSRAFNVSERTIRYDIQIIKPWLEDQGIELFRKPRLGVWIDVNKSQKLVLQSRLQGFNKEHKVYSIKERKKIILFELLKSTQPVRAKDLANRLGVSQTTIMKDLSLLKNDMSCYQLKLVSRPNHGNHILGSELDIRELLVKIVFENEHEAEMLHVITKNNSIAEEFNRIENIYGLNQDIKLVDIQRIIQVAKSRYHFRLSDNSFFSLLVHIAVAIDRLKKGKTIKKIPTVLKQAESKKEYEIAAYIMERLSDKYGIVISNTETMNIAIHLISSRIKVNLNYS